MPSRLQIGCLLMLAMIGALGHQQSAFAQGVSSRSANPDEPRINADSGAGQARSIYSQKLSGHRMMHFGKRPLVPEAATFVVEPVAKRSARQLQPQQELALAFPAYSQPALSQDEKAASRRQHIMEIVSNLLEISRKRDFDEQQQQQQQLLLKQRQAAWMVGQQVPERLPATFKLMRLAQEAGAGSAALESPVKIYTMESKRWKANGAAATDDPDEEIIDLDRHMEDAARPMQLTRSQNLVEAKPSTAEQVGEQQQPQMQLQSQGQQLQQQQQQDGENISLSSRSVPIHHMNDELATRAVVSNLLYGRQILGQRGNSILGAGNFIKKTEPQRMTFMHFG